MCQKTYRVVSICSLVLFTLLVGGSLWAQDQPLLTDTAQKESSSPDSPGRSTEALTQKYGLPTMSPGAEMTLAGALTAADERNLTLAAMRTDIESAQAQLKTAWGGALPVVNAKLEYKLNDHDDTFDLADSFPEIPGLPPMDDVPPTVVMPQQDLRGSLQAAMPIFSLQAWSNISVAKDAIDLTGLSVEAMRQQLLLNVAESYFAAMMAGKLIELQTSTMASFDHHLEVAQTMFDSGAGLRLDVIRATTDLETAKQQIISANLLYDNARDALRILTGAEELPIPASNPPIGVPKGSDDDLIKQGLSKRFDIQANRATEILNRTQLKAANMQYVPTIDAVWMGTYQFTDPGDMGSDDRSRMFGMFSLTVPIFNYYRYGDVGGKRAALEKASLMRKDAEWTASMEVRKARRDYLAALASVEVANSQSSLSREALALTVASYSAGTGTSLDVTDARRLVLQTDVDVASKTLEAQISLLRLLHAIGDNMAELGQ